MSEAKRQVDYLLVSIHSHEMKAEHLDEPADFIVDTKMLECLGYRTMFGGGVFTQFGQMVRNTKNEHSSLDKIDFL